MSDPFKELDSYSSYIRKTIEAMAINETKMIDHKGRSNHVVRSTIYQVCKFSDKLKVETRKDEEGSVWALRVEV